VNLLPPPHGCVTIPHSIGLTSHTHTHTHTHTHMHGDARVQVPHAFVTEHELRQGAVAVAGEADRAKRELEKQVALRRCGSLVPLSCCLLRSPSWGLCFYAWSAAMGYPPPHTAPHIHTHQFVVHSLFDSLRSLPVGPA
jgi:hypothetical protein